MKSACWHSGATLLLVAGCAGAPPLPPVDSAQPNVAAAPASTEGRAVTSAPTHKTVLLNVEQGIDISDWELSSEQLTPSSTGTWSVKQRALSGGPQDGVRVIEVNNGRLSMTVVPTRGMSVYEVEADGVRLGWSSPVKELVNPALIHLGDNGGLGWLDGFNEWMVRCGYEFAGLPGDDGGRPLTLHGKAGNIPASEVLVIVDPEPPHRIRIRGKVNERVFQFTNLEMWTEISTVPGSAELRIDDVLTNKSGYEQEFQLIYHGNFGAPLLEQGARFVAPVKRVAPFDDDSVPNLATFAEYSGPTAGFKQEVYKLVPYSDDQGLTTLMLHNRAADRGVSVSYNVSELPYLALWKKTDLLSDGYVTGIEPTTSYPYNRSVERKHGRVPTLAGGASRRFTLDYAILKDAASVEATRQRVLSIQGGRKSEVHPTPEP